MPESVTTWQLCPSPTHQRLLLHIGKDQRMWETAAASQRPPPRQRLQHRQVRKGTPLPSVLHAHGPASSPQMSNGAAGSWLDVGVFQAIQEHRLFQDSKHARCVSGATARRASGRGRAPAAHPLRTGCALRSW